MHHLTTSPYLCCSPTQYPSTLDISLQTPTLWKKRTSRNLHWFQSIDCRFHVMSRVKDWLNTRAITGELIDHAESAHRFNPISPSTLPHTVSFICIATTRRSPRSFPSIRSENSDEKCQRARVEKKNWTHSAYTRWQLSSRTQTMVTNHRTTMKTTRRDVTRVHST